MISHRNAVSAFAVEEAVALSFGRWGEFDGCM
jgi:hypothetical protein